MKPKIIFEDDTLLVIDKPAGIAMHAGNMKGTETTVVDFIRKRVSDPDPERPGIVHRLDKDTSGLIIIAKDAKTKAYLQSQFKEHKVQKAYIALVIGKPKLPEAILDWPIGRHRQNPLKRTVLPGGKPARTHYKIKTKYPGFSLLEVWPQTGRTHQIRVHLSKFGHPIAGDKLYGRAHPELKRHFLHAAELKFIDASGQKRSFKSPLPQDLDQFLKKLTTS